MEKTAIEVKNLYKDYGEGSVLCDFNLRVQKGEMVVFLGESGCGKTTLLRILAGLEKETKGQVFLNGQSMDERIPPNKRNIAMVFQEPALWNHLTIFKNISYSMEKTNDKVIGDIMGELGIIGLEKRYPEELSGGQAKRVALARALVSNRDILLLDEPVSNLDDVTKYKILKYIEQNYKGKKTILYVTHSKAEADFFNCRQIKMNAED